MKELKAPLIRKRGLGVCGLKADNLQTTENILTKHKKIYKKLKKL